MKKATVLNAIIVFGILLIQQSAYSANKDCECFPVDNNSEKGALGVCFERKEATRNEHADVRLDRSEDSSTHKKDKTTKTGLFYLANRFITRLNLVKCEAIYKKRISTQQED